ncbi:hypothetical protein SAMN05660216_00573 [Pseudomonas sp. LAMO17WK12:I8]|nr:hypothetical protein [Pseudomonas sp. OG7]SMC36709.1 hypothetical protein SAMN05660385_00345 [Pseudomonas sp. URIL14HWK12:I5]SNB52137.1 hypothetical protein SAMN02745900_00325 [Pseudomonas sp. URIL14HWK12:I8]SNS41601.1 hypothetical protein SAMN05660216_00573 [Pseudomonas sp. LAMO17WK12:I8]SNY02148.1 hypothetical protein SAMN05660893_00575 [Pseudomonas sp. LAMO17WK12:I12]SNY02398.1 hypothetical protein SAMN05660344_00575 [Pseudomonas sp. LAMO17WK12:I11]SNY02613.1 hypothetical protein SAMN05
MVRLPRPESTAWAVPSGTSAVFASFVNGMAALAAIIDVWRSRARPRSGLPLFASSSCLSNSLRTQLFSVYPLWLCAGVFALAMYSIQNQSVDHLTS